MYNFELKFHMVWLKIALLVNLFELSQKLKHLYARFFLFKIEIQT